MSLMSHLPLGLELEHPSIGLVTSRDPIFQVLYLDLMIRVSALVLKAQGFGPDLRSFKLWS